MRRGQVMGKEGVLECGWAVSDAMRLTQFRLTRFAPQKALAGDPIESMLTTAPGNGAALGGLKVVTRRGWFAARPSGAEDVYKIYAESFAGEEHLRQIQQEARELVGRALGAG